MIFCDLVIEIDKRCEVSTAEQEVMKQRCCDGMSETHATGRSRFKYLRQEGNQLMSWFVLLRQ